MAARNRIYLDHAASSPITDSVRQAMTEFLQRDQGNPSSQHREGRTQRGAVDRARAALADHLRCSFGEVVFTAGGTEAAMLAIIGTALACYDNRRRKVVMSAAEHHCVLHQAKLLSRLGFEVIHAPVSRIARVDLNALEDLVDNEVLLVCLMHANNEFGTWQPVREAAEIAHRHGALVFSDCVQTLGVEDPNSGHWTPDSLDLDLASFSAHKIGGPKGIGALYIRAGTKTDAVILGGGQEREMRAGTEPTVLIHGFGQAVQDLKVSPPHGAAARAFEEALDSNLVQLTVPHVKNRHPEIIHLRIPGLLAETAVIRLDQEGLAIGSGAACSSGSLEPSHVMRAAGYSHAESKEGLRFSFSRWQTAEEGRQAANLFSEVAGKMVQYQLPHA